MRELHTPTIKDLETAHEIFMANETRDLFYRAATELVDLATRGDSSLSVAEAVAVLLHAWNQSYYRYHSFDRVHVAAIESLIARHEQAITEFRQRSIEAFSGKEEEMVADLFEEFEEVLGPVGTAKCLHLLAPSFFPLWDRAIAKAYHLSLQQRGTNGSRYCRFMKITKAQRGALGKEQNIGYNPLKVLDEYNYCRYSKGWI